MATFTTDDIIVNFAKLDAQEKVRLFHMIKQNADILIKVVPNSPLLHYLATGEGDISNPVIAAFKQWQESLLKQLF